VKQLDSINKVDIFSKECMILSNRGHFITRYMGACVHKLENEKVECLILTELGTMGSLSTLLYGDQKKRKEFKMNFHVKCRILRDVARGMKFIHDMKLVTVEK